MTPQRRTDADTHRLYYRAVCENAACSWAVDPAVEHVDDAHDRARRHTMDTGHPTSAVGEIEIHYTRAEPPA